MWGTGIWGSGEGECPAGPIELRYGQEKIAALLAMTIMPIYDLRPERQL